MPEDLEFASVCDLDGVNEIPCLKEAWHGL